MPTPFEDFIEGPDFQFPAGIDCPAVHPIIVRSLERIETDALGEYELLPDLVKQATACLAVEFAGRVLADPALIEDQEGIHAGRLITLLRYLLRASFIALSDLEDHFSDQDAPWPL